jgi:hypothetical protein
MYVYLRQGAQSGKDCGRQRHKFVVAKVKAPVGKKEEAVRLTLFRHRSAFACTSVRVRACQCASKLRTYTSYGNVQTHVYAVNEVLLPYNAFAKHASDMYTYSHTNIKHTMSFMLK